MYPDSAPLAPLASISTCGPLTRPCGPPLVCERICTPEFRLLCTFTSKTNSKLPYSLSVHRKEFGLPALVVPTMVPSLTSYVAVPLRWVQPSRVFPSKMETKFWPSSSANATEPIRMTKAEVSIWYLFMGYFPFRWGKRFSNLCVLLVLWLWRESH